MRNAILLLFHHNESWCESVKALFRPCAMIVPDMDLICEIMLMSEGYSEGKVLARKFMMLYRLSEALLSAQKHYDWKLRAVKTTLNVAGGMRRLDMQNTECVPPFSPM